MRWVLQRGFDIVQGLTFCYQGRLYYTTGEVRRAVQFFLSLLGRPSHPTPPPDNASEVPRDLAMDKVYLEDFRVAFQVLKPIRL
jgi:trafficking protein particle complex subunit 8